MNPVVDKSRCVRHTSLKGNITGGRKFRAGYARSFSEISPFAKRFSAADVSAIFGEHHVNGPETLETCVECAKCYPLRKMTRREAGWTCHNCKTDCYGHKIDILPTGFMKDWN